MTRARLDYSARRAPVAAPGFDPDTPIAGLYRLRLRSGGMPVGIRIWHGAPLDPETGEELDRGHRWQATANGRYIDLERVWPRCAAEPIDQAEHDHLAGLQRWGEENDVPAVADPTKRLDPLQTPMMF